FKVFSYRLQPKINIGRMSLIPVKIYSTTANHNHSHFVFMATFNEIMNIFIPGFNHLFLNSIIKLSVFSETSLEGKSRISWHNLKKAKTLSAPDSAKNSASCIFLLSSFVL